MNRIFVALASVLTVALVGFQTPASAAGASQQSGAERSRAEHSSGGQTTSIQGIEIPSLGAPLASGAEDTEILSQGIGVSVEGTKGDSTTVTRLGIDTLDVDDKNGQAVFEGTSAGVDTIAESTESSARILEVIQSEAGENSFNYHVSVPEGMKLHPQSDGSILIGRQRTVEEKVVLDVDSVINAPWAVDADGASVKVSYSVGARGDLRMNVNPTSANKYPIVADPTVTKGGFRASWSRWSPATVTIHLNKARTADAEDGGAVICVGIAFVPVVGPVLAAVCAVHNTVIRATSRRGYCQRWTINAVRRKFEVGLYRGGYCT